MTTETRILELVEADPSADGEVLQKETPPIALAYEGLMRLVEAGKITRHDAIAEHRAMFPDC